MNSKSRISILKASSAETIMQSMLVTLIISILLALAFEFNKNQALQQKYAYMICCIILAGILWFVIAKVKERSIILYNVLFRKDLRYNDFKENVLIPYKMFKEQYLKEVLNLLEKTTDIEVITNINTTMLEVMAHQPNYDYERGIDDLKDLRGFL